MRYATKTSATILTLGLLTLAVLPLAATDDRVETLAKNSDPSPWTETGNDIFFDGGRVGIGTSTPSNKLTVENGELTVIDTNKIATLRSTGRSAFLAIENANGGANSLGRFTDGAEDYFWIDSASPGAFAPELVIRDGNVGIGTLEPEAALDVEGTTRTHVLEITGGADLAEPFGLSAGQTLVPGSVVAIDAADPGKLRVADAAYDRAVAGVVSGAGGVHPGMLMGQIGSIAHGDVPVALTGRVYTWVDASFGAIEPGDLLTTSPTSGHAMKAADAGRSQGAILGKAMTRLEKGRGLVLTLVGLQ